MALFKIYKGLSNNLKNTPNPQKENVTQLTKEGHCYFTTDDGKFYIDIVNNVTPIYPNADGSNFAEVTRMPINAFKADRAAIAEWSARALADVNGNDIHTYYANSLSINGYKLKLIAADTTNTLSEITLPSDVESAKQFTSAKTVKLTGAVTGEKSSQAGWEIATTLSDNVVTTSKIAASAVTAAKIADGTITNAKIANSTIANAKLVNSSITIGGKSVSLGGSLTLADLGLNSALRFIGQTTTAIVDGSTTSPISINGSNVTPTTGDVVINSNNNQEYVWLETKWELLGDESSYALKDHTHSVATESLHGLLSKEDKIKLNNTNIAYGTCATAAATAAKVITLNGNTQWALKNGSLIMVTFANSNTASNVTLNVNGTGAYPIWYNNAAYTSNSSAYTGYKDRTITYMFNGTHWVWISSSYDANTQSNTNSTDTDSKIFIIGATSQGSNKTTYSHDTAYVGTDGCLYSGGEKVSVEGHTHNYAGSSSAGGAANSVQKSIIIKLNGGTTEGTDLFTFNGSTAKTINITPSSIGASLSTHTHTVAHTPAGSVSQPTFTGTKATISTTYTPGGSVSQPTFTGNAVASGAPSATTTVQSITSVGTTPTLTMSVTNKCLSIVFGAGSTPTRTAVTVPTSTHTHTTTATGTVSKPTFTGTQATISTDYTPAGTVSKPTFTGTAATLTSSAPQ